MSDYVYRKFYRMNAIAMEGNNHDAVTKFVKKFTTVLNTDTIEFPNCIGLHIETETGEYNLRKGDYLIWLGESRGFSLMSNREFIALWDEFRKEIIQR